METSESTTMEIKALKENIGKIQEEKNSQEKEFNQKRSKFFEMYSQQIDTIKEKDNKFKSVSNENEKLNHLVEELTGEVNDLTMAVQFTEEEFSEVKRKYDEEIATYQQLMTAAADEATDSTSAKYEHERLVLMNVNKNLEEEVDELRKRAGSEIGGEGFFSSVTQKLKSKVAGGSNSTLDNENLEDSMKKAKKDADALKAVVVPLEVEIESLKKKLKKAHGTINKLEGKASQESPSSESSVSPVTERKYNILDDDSMEPEEKMLELNKYLQAEKSSRTDLEMFVAVLNTQKQVLGDDNDQLRNELHEVCKLLEREKKQHNDLSLTWQMANDQFLESQRLMMMDMRRMESVLSEEQQRQIAELQKKDQEREEQERKVKTLEQKSHEHQERQRAESLMDESQEADSITPQSLESPVLTTTSLNTSVISPASQLISNIMDNQHVHLDFPKSASSSQLDNQSIGGFSDSSSYETRSLQDDSSVTLTDAQEKSLRDPTPENEESKSLLASVKLSNDSAISLLLGRRQVSDKEWDMLQKELQTSRAKLGRPCDMCKNYEAQLQTIQTELKEKREEIKTLQSNLSDEQLVNTNHVKYREELENNLKDASEDAQAQISQLANKVQETENLVETLKHSFNSTRNDLTTEMKQLTKEREDIQKELVKLQDENDSLVGKHSKTAQELQNEDINLPNNIEEMQLVLLRYRENAISAKVSEDHTSQQLKSEIMFHKDRLVDEQQEKTRIEEALLAEINSLQDQLVNLQSVSSELERESRLRRELEGKYKETDKQLQSSEAKSRQMIRGLTSQVEEHVKARNQLETDILRAKNKISALQIDLDNNEAVQRDFVKLSQSLQVQLEKIRQGENEVRWQHEEDVLDCNSCHEMFSVTRRKHHCRHCGKVFCSDCTSKTVLSGPSQRTSRVCDVCHTILVKDATPYFSTEAPST